MSSNIFSYEEKTTSMSPKQWCQVIHWTITTSSNSISSHQLRRNGRNVATTTLQPYSDHKVNPNTPTSGAVARQIIQHPAQLKQHLSPVRTCCTLSAVMWEAWQGDCLQIWLVHLFPGTQAVSCLCTSSLRGVLGCWFPYTSCRWLCWGQQQHGENVVSSKHPYMWDENAAT